MANAVTARPIKLLAFWIFVLAGCNRASLVDAPDRAFGELHVIVGSFSGSGTNPDKVRIGVRAESLGTTASHGTSVSGIGTAATLPLPVGSWRVWIRASTEEQSRLGFPFFCESITDVPTVTVLEDRTTVLNPSLVCTALGGVRVRTSVTGIETWLPLKVQFAASPGLCDLADLPQPDDPVWANPDVFEMFPVGVSNLIGLRPGAYTLSLCGLPAQCPTDRQSRTFEVREEDVSEVLFEVHCEGQGPSVDGATAPAS